MRGDKKSSIFYCTRNFSINGFLWSIVPLLCLVEISSPEDVCFSHRMAPSAQNYRTKANTDALYG